jgi:hypothetical protein
MTRTLNRQNRSDMQDLMDAEKRFCPGILCPVMIFRCGRTTPSNCRQILLPTQNRGKGRPLKPKRNDTKSSNPQERWRLMAGR